MRIGYNLRYDGGFTEAVEELREHEQAGLDVVWVAEAYSFDAVSQLGFVAARTSRVEIGSAILQLYTRTPSLTAMTAAGLDYVSGGRFILGLGASNPQVIEGFHGLKYDAPLGRTREIIDICRQVWRREKVQYQGKHYQVPLPAEQGSGLGKPLKIINHPVRDNIPIIIASLGEKNVAMTAEIANGWLPFLYIPEHAGKVWGDALAKGKAKRDPALGELDVVLQSVGAHITEDADEARKLHDQLRPQVALYIGGMGAKGKNFYNEVARRYGYEEVADKIQDLYLDGQKREAEAAVPDDMLEAMALIGSRSHVQERLAAHAAAGVTTINVAPMAQSAADRTRLIGEIKGMAADL